jgi:hypothetical protein
MTVVPTATPIIMIASLLKTEFRLIVLPATVPGDLHSSPTPLSSTTSAAFRLKAHTWPHHVLTATGKLKNGASGTLDYDAMTVTRISMRLISIKNTTRSQIAGTVIPPQCGAALALITEKQHLYFQESI